jgi:hypothetical protein
MIRSYPLEEFTVGDDRAKPRLTREQVIHRVLEHPHMHSCDEVGELFEWNQFHVWNFIHITDHHNRFIWHIREASQDALALIFFSCPWVLIFGRLVRLDDDVLNLMYPFSVTLFIVFKIQLFGSTHVVHLGLDEYETVNVLVEALESKFEHIEFIVEHECIH